MTSRHQVIPAVYLLLIEGNRLLMLRRAGTGYMDGYYSLVAGHLEGGEPLSRAIMREAEEEVGIYIAEDALQLIHVVHTPPEPGDTPEQERIDFYFKVSVFSGKVSNCEPHKCDDIGWFEIDQLPGNIVPRVAAALRGILAGTLLSEPHWGDMASSI